MHKLLRTLDKKAEFLSEIEWIVTFVEPAKEITKVRNPKLLFLHEKHYWFKAIWQDIHLAATLDRVKSKDRPPVGLVRCTVGRRFTYQALRVVLEPVSRNRQQHCFKILWSFNFCPSGAVHRWSMVATLGVRRMASPELVIQSPQIRFHFCLYFPKKIR